MTDRQYLLFRGKEWKSSLEFLIQELHRAGRSLPLVNEESTTRKIHGTVNHRLGKVPNVDAPFRTLRLYLLLHRSSNKMIRSSPPVISR